MHSLRVATRPSCRSLLRLAIAALLVLGLMPCGASAQNVTLTVTKGGTGVGEVLTSAGGSAETVLCADTCSNATASFAAGTTVRVRWFSYGPTNFTLFNGWTGCDSTSVTGNNTPTCTITLNADRTVIASSTQYAYSLSVVQDGIGTATLNFSTSTSYGAFTCQTASQGSYCSFMWSTPFTATVSAAPDSQTAFYGWSGSGCSGTAPCAVNVTGHQLVTAMLGSASIPPPVFALTVTSDITPTTSTATAAMKFRPQDVGSTASIYVFAFAPKSAVKSARHDDGAEPTAIALRADGVKDSTDGCTLAQLDGSGQLTGVGSSQLKPYLTGVLGAQGSTVTILNAVSTPAVSGATFYVGYGTSSGAMFANGVYRNAVTVPGTTTCPMVSSQTGLWWNPAESGWGINFAHQGNMLFGTLFDYDANHQPLWLVMSNGAVQPDGLTFKGDLYQTSGPAFNANPFTPISAANLAKVGTMSVAFQDVNSASLQYTVNGTQVTKGIQRQVFGSRAAACFPTTAARTTLTNYQDLWWNPNESGWGLNIAHQDDTLFATLFTYDPTGKDLWLVMTGGVKQADGSFAGTLYRTSGPSFDASPFTPISSSNINPVGTMRLVFSSGDTGTLTYTYNGAQVTKSITRQVFAALPPACN